MNWWNYLSKIIIIGFIILSVISAWVILLQLPVTESGLKALANPTPYHSFSISLNETFSEHYMIYDQIYSKDHPSYYSRMLLSTVTPGTYRIKVTTDYRNDEIIFYWSETFEAIRFVGDKFDRHDEPIRVVHWVDDFPATGHYKCVSDRNSDCIITAIQGQGEKPELQLYITGRGSGNITIERIE